MPLIKIVSGGQSGGDYSGWLAAKAVGLETGGYMPKGFLTQMGLRPEYASLYNAREMESPLYPPRTLLNVRSSDGTIRLFTDGRSAGERLTLKYIKQESKPHFDVDFLLVPMKRPIDLAVWICENAIRTLNVAGNSLKTSPNMEKLAFPFLLETFRLVLERQKHGD